MNVSPAREAHFQEMEPPLKKKIGPKMAKDGPKMAKDGPKIAKLAQDWSQDCSLGMADSISLHKGPPERAK